jgi:hypothetical protein
MFFEKVIITLLMLCIITVVNAAVLPEQIKTNNNNNNNKTTPISTPNTSLTSDNFTIHARTFNKDTNTSTTLGYLHAEYAYPPGYYATLHTSRSEAIIGHLTDMTTPENSSLVFGSGEYTQGFVLGLLSMRYSAGIAMIYSGRQGTKGVFVDEGGSLDWASQRVGWYGEFFAVCFCFLFPFFFFFLFLSFADSCGVACEQSLEWGTATAVWYKLQNATTPSNCVDIQLITEYVSPA